MNAFELDEEDCIEWKRNKSINPFTGRKIKEGSAIYNKIENICSYIKTPKVAKESPKYSKNNKYDDEDCIEWKRNKLVNPLTGKKIQEGKGIYNELKKSCSHINSNDIKSDSYKSPKKYSDEHCIQWKKNKLVNPLTGRKIQEGKGVYNDLKKNCSHIKSLEAKKDKSPKSPKSPKKPKTKKYTDDDCVEWKWNKLVNPLTGRKIQEGKGVYNDLKKNCSHIKSPQRK